MATWQEQLRSYIETHKSEFIKKAIKKSQDEEKEYRETISKAIEELMRGCKDELR